MKSTSSQVWPKEATADGHVRVGPLFGIAIVLRQAGIDPAQLYAEAGLRADLFDDPDNLVSFRKAGHLLAICVDRTDYEDFGLRAGKMSGAATLGIAGFLVQHSATVGAALHNHPAPAPARPRRGAHVLGGRRESIGLRHLRNRDESSRADQRPVDHRGLDLPGLSRAASVPTEVRLARRGAHRCAALPVHFEAPVVFDAQRDLLLFPSRWLERPVPGADRQLLKYLGNASRNSTTRTGARSRSASAR